MPQKKKLSILSIVAPVVMFFIIIGVVIWFYSSHKLIYVTSFINETEVTIPLNIFEKIDPSNRLEIRITKNSEYNTYTTHFETEHEIYTETNTTHGGIAGTGKEYGNDDLLIHKTPRTQNMKVTITPQSSKPFRLEVYELKY